MKKTKVSPSGIEGKLSYNINVETEKEMFVIPVVDVRDGDTARKVAEAAIKASNSSRFMKPTFSSVGGSYQTSHKK